MHHADEEIEALRTYLMDLHTSKVVEPRFKAISV